ncbi:MAG: hypothetical protein WCL07_01430 [bacterium]
MSHHETAGGVDWSNPLVLVILPYLVMADIADSEVVEDIRTGGQRRGGGGHGH